MRVRCVGSTHLISADGRVLELLWDHESDVVRLDELLLVQPRVHGGQTLPQLVDLRLERPLHLLDPRRVRHHSSRQGLVESEVHALSSKKKIRSVAYWHTLKNRLTSIRSERSSTKYFCTEEFAASMQSRYSFLALVAFSRDSSNFCFLL